MIIKYKTKPNKNGNSYGLIVDTDKKPLSVAGASVQVGILRLQRAKLTNIYNTH